MARRAGRTARRTRLRQRLRLGLHHARRPGLRRRRAGRLPVLLPARLPPDRRRAAPARLRTRGRRGRARATDRSTTFFRVVLPAISPAVLGGALLVGLHLLGEYGALQILNYPTLTTGILGSTAPRSTGRRPPCWPWCSWSFCLLLLGLELLARGHRRRARVGAGVSRTATRFHLGGRAWPVVAGTRRPRGAGPGRAPGQPGPLAAARHVDHVPRRRHLRGDRDHARPGRGRRGRRDPGGPPGRLARRPPSGPARDCRRAQRLPGQRAARDRGRAGAGDHLDRVVPGDLPDAAAAGARLLHPVPAAGRRERPGDPGARAAGPRRRRALARVHGCRGRPAGDPAAGAAGPRRQHGAGLAGRQHRADRHAAARADRHLDPRHRVLVARLGGRVRRGGPVRPAPDRALGPGDLAALASRQPGRPAHPRECRPGGRADERPARHRTVEDVRVDPGPGLARPRGRATASPRCSARRGAARPRCCAGRGLPRPRRRHHRDRRPRSSPARVGRCRRAPAGSGTCPRRARCSRTST